MAEAAVRFSSARDDVVNVAAIAVQILGVVAGQRGEGDHICTTTEHVAHGHTDLSHTCTAFHGTSSQHARQQIAGPPGPACLRRCDAPDRT